MANTFNDMSWSLWLLESSIPKKNLRGLSLAKKSSIIKFHHHKSKFILHVYMAPEFSVFKKGAKRYLGKSHNFCFPKERQIFRKHHKENLQFGSLEFSLWRNHPTCKAKISLGFFVPNKVPITDLIG